MRFAVYSCIAAGVALTAGGIIATTPANSPVPDVAVPAIQLSAGSTQDVDQAFLNLLQLIGPDTDNLVSDAVEIPEPADLGGVGGPPIQLPDLDNGPAAFTLPPSVWTDAFDQNG